MLMVRWGILDDTCRGALRRAPIVVDPVAGRSAPRGTARNGVSARWRPLVGHAGVQDPGGRSRRQRFRGERPAPCGVRRHRLVPSRLDRRMRHRADVVGSESPRSRRMRDFVADLQARLRRPARSLVPGAVVGGLVVPIGGIRSMSAVGGRPRRVTVPARPFESTGVRDACRRREEPRRQRQPAEAAP